MKKTRNFLLIAMALIAPFYLASCGGQTPAGSDTDGEKTEVQSDVMTITQVLELDADHVGQEVTVAGDVKHVCQHAGRRCFITDDSGQEIRVEAGDQIEAFPSDLIGYPVVIKGILREQHISPEQINEMEQRVEEHAKEEGADEGHCNSQRDNIMKMRQWMEDNGKEFYAFYYIDGLSYEKQEE